MTAARSASTWASAIDVAGVATATGELSRRAMTAAGGATLLAVEQAVGTLGEIVDVDLGLIVTDTR